MVVLLPWLRVGLSPPVPYFRFEVQAEEAVAESYDER